MPGRNFRRIPILVLIFALVLSMLSGCTKSDDSYGGIDDVEIDAEEKAEPTSPFNKLESPFEEYTYRQVDFACAGMTFDIPGTWNEEIVNPSCIRYDVPGDDPYFGGARFYIKCNYDYKAVENEYDPFTHIASEFGKNMSPYITGLPYPYRDGKDLWIESYHASDIQDEVSFTDDETAASLKVTRDVVLINKVTADVQALYEWSFVAGYFRWHDYAAMVATLVPTEWYYDAERMIEYIMSSAVDNPQKLSDSVQQEYRGIKLELPSDFQATSKEGNVFRASEKDIKSTSGMSIGVFKIDEDLNDIDLRYVQDNYADDLVRVLMSEDAREYYYTAASCYDYEGPRLADEKIAFASNVIFDTDLYDYTGAERLYGMGGMWYMDMFIVEKGDSAYMVAALYSQQQLDVAAKVIKRALQSLQVDR